MRQLLRHAIAAIAAVASLLAWSRFTPAVRDVLWAEDGRNFLQGAIDSGPFASLFIPYGGYLHTIPRIIAALTVQLVPVSQYAQAMTAGACIAAGVMAAIVFVCSADVVSWLPGRLMIASLTVLVPLAPREVLGNTANLHSLVLWTLFWMLLYRPRTRRGGYLLAVAALLGSLTEIQGAFLFPLLFVQARDRRRWPLRIAYLVGVVAQLTVTLIWPRHHNADPAVGPASVIYGYLINAVAPVWISQSSVGPFAASAGPAFFALLAIPFALALVVILKLGTRKTRGIALALTALSVLVFVASIAETPSLEYDYATLSVKTLASISPIRYGVLPSMMLCALIPIACSVLISRRHPTLRRHPNLARILAAAGSVILAFALVAQFLPPSRRAGGPEWQPQVASAVVLCAQLPDSSRIALDETIGWHVEVPCWRLEAPGNS
jgi:hypothetical protein